MWHCLLLLLFYLYFKDLNQIIEILNNNGNINQTGNIFTFSSKS